MGLDILTERGQRTVADLDEAISIFLFKNPGLVYTKTPEDKPADIDGIISSQSDEMKAVVEVKCRYNVTHDDFRRKFNNEWLVTMDKLTRASFVSKSLGVPLYGFLYLVDDRTLLTKALTDDKGMFTAAFRCEVTATQRTVNGGQALRPNAYIDMSGCRVLTKFRQLH